MASVIAKNMLKRYGDVVALDHVSFEVEPGEFFFLLGPSGCGKSTMLRILAGLTAPDSGEVYFDGTRVTDIPAYKRDTGMVFQNYALWPHMSVWENVAYGLRVRKVPSKERKHRVMGALRMVRMAEFADRRPTQLSGGQQQRIALARALVIEPKVLLLDEPLSNLDAKLRAEMRDELRRIHRESGITTVYVTHDQKEALALADRIAVMSTAHIEQIGSPRDVYASPANPFVAEFMGQANLIEGVRVGTKEGMAVFNTAYGEVRTESGKEVEEGESILLCVRPEAIRIDGGEGDNKFTARLLNTTYFGESVGYLLELVPLPGRTPGPRNTILAVLLSTKASQPKAGEMLEVSFACGEVMVLAHEPPSPQPP